MTRTAIISYARTPFGKLGGALKELKATELGAVALRAAIERGNIDINNIDMVIMGHVLSGGCGQIPARQSSIMAGISPQVPVDSINKVCASSLRAVTMADQIIRAGDAKLIVAGGMESMSNAPYISYDMRYGHKMFNTEFVDLMVKDGLWCPAYDCHMAVHGGKVALENGITREMQDEWALESQKRAQKAMMEGYLEREIVEVKLPKGEILTSDEAPRANVTLEGLRELKPLFSKENTVTAGNAPGVNDGASALVLAEEEYIIKNNIVPEAVIIGHAMSSEDPQNIATAPGNAIKKLLERTEGITIDDIDLFEINEAFAAVTLLSSKIAGCDTSKVNVNGGAIAFGHPLGASGGRILMTLLSELQRRNKKYGIAAICSGMGQGDAVLIENCKYKK